MSEVIENSGEVLFPLAAMSAEGLGPSLSPSAVGLVGAAELQLGASIVRFGSYLV